MEQISEALLLKLCSDRCPESNTLDFKRELPGSSDKDKHELLKDVCALANADGGDLVYGIAESDGGAEAITSITDELPDAAKRRLSQVLDAGIDPRVHGIRLHHVDVNGGYILIIRVPGSYDSPHSLRVNNHLRRFVVRNGTSSTDMTFDQIRAAFDRTATLGERARKFIDQRIEMLISDKGPKRLIDGAVAVVHVVPIAGLSGRHSVDLGVLHGGNYTQFNGDWGSCGRTFNFDGLVIHPGQYDNDGTYYAFTQVFRTGALEAAEHAGEKRDVNGRERAIVWPKELVAFYRNTIAKFIAAAKQWEIGGPVILRFALLNAEGFELMHGTAYRRFSQPLRDRQHLILPEVWVEDIESASLDNIVRPMMDMLWQAFDVPRCSEFNLETGRYDPGA